MRLEVVEVAWQVLVLLVNGALLSESDDLLNDLPRGTDLLQIFLRQK